MASLSEACRATSYQNIHCSSTGSSATCLSHIFRDRSSLPSSNPSDQTLLSSDSFSALPVSLVRFPINSDDTIQSFIQEHRNRVLDYESTPALGINLFKQKKKVITKFCIELNNNRTVFLPGQKVEGNAKLHLSTSVKLKLIRLRFSGSVLSSLCKDTSSLSRSTSFLTIFKDMLTVLGSAVLSDPEVEIVVGEHNFPFSFRVPPASLPASFEGFNGYVRYEVTAILVREEHSNRTCSVLITVPSTVDASENEYQCPVRMNTNLPGGLFWNMGHINVNTSIPKKAFA
ncbi:hypothetical protein HK096_009718, partial [Nowakowskiella sp. JEL0078]